MIKRNTLLRIAKYVLGLFFIVSLLVVFMLSNLLSRKVIVYVENRSSNVIAVEVVLWEPNMRDYGDEPVRHLLRFNLEPGEALQRLLLPADGGGNIGTAVRDGPNEYWDYGQYLLGMGSFFYLEKNIRWFTAVRASSRHYVPVYINCRLELDGIPTRGMAWPVAGPGYAAYRGCITPQVIYARLRRLWIAAWAWLRSHMETKTVAANSPVLAQ
ncbi:hypothetical protein [Sinorhizobium medicae]|uniref:hypothetical protein n=1 Tax=Sinorhizobium medicae TaxID=110321 RepID=UPI001F47FAFA|nr:hypothetical protein [Sinorhizobium medicae]